MGSSLLTDRFHRQFTYLRLSLLPVCNFKCSYCLPNGNPKEALHRSHLTVDEIRRLTKAFSGLGIRKIRLTGGEPTLRTDLIKIVETLSLHHPDTILALTTNGFKLTELAGPLKKAGLSCLNVSVDSLVPEKFEKITGQNMLAHVLKGIETAKQVGISKIKINTVVLKGINDGEIGALIDWAEKSDLELRFIELMETGDRIEYFKEHHSNLDFIQNYLLERGYLPAARAAHAGPADIWQNPKIQSRMGLIRPYRKDFCESCNRLRVTSEGALQLCLFGSGTLSLRSYLERDGEEENIQDAVLSALGAKTKTHLLHEGNYGITRNLATIGG